MVTAACKKDIALRYLSSDAWPQVKPETGVVVDVTTAWPATDPTDGALGDVDASLSQMLLRDSTIDSVLAGSIKRGKCAARDDASDGVALPRP
jgi:hypothetical protein